MKKQRKKGEKSNVTDKTKVNNLSESFAKYSELKSDKMESLSELIEGSDNYLLPMAMLPFAAVDLAAIPATICGLEKEAAVGALFLYQNVDYSTKGNKCTVTYLIDDETTAKFVANYDPKTDSATMNMFENNVHTMTSEYAKIKNGYATQFYSIDEEDSDNITVYKSLFEGDDMYSSIFENTSKPVSIFKNNNLTNDFAKNGDNLYIEIIDGVINAVVDGETIDSESAPEE